ncbi:MAG: hypothetical protein HYW65_00040 [Candidatus Liptonbacteria bacterium]|nr:hypothetical protein [Candidatus Liptonbacteria bacterium]
MKTLTAALAAFLVLTTSTLAQTLATNVPPAAPTITTNAPPKTPPLLLRVVVSDSHEMRVYASDPASLDKLDLKPLLERLAKKRGKTATVAATATPVPQQALPLGAAPNSPAVPVTP